MSATETRTTRRSFTAGTAVMATLALTVACGTVPNQGVTAGASTHPQGSSSTPTAAGGQRWVATDTATATGPPRGGNVVRVSPDGKVVLVAGGGPTVAYDAASGKQLWQAIEDGMPGGATWLAVSPDGSAVYVAATTTPESDAAYLTVAYGLTDGRRLWAATFKGTGAGQHNVASVVATTSLVIIDGVTPEGTSGTTVVTIAYDAKTGAQKWVARPDASEGALGWFPSGGHSLAVNPGGTMAFVTTGSSVGDVAGVATFAYDTATGARKWTARFESPDRGNALGSAVAVSPDGSTLVTTGLAHSPATQTDSVTIGYDAATGKQRWARTYNGPANQNEGTGLVAFHPDGDTVFVAGTSEGATAEREDMIVLAFDTVSGAQRWAARWDGPAGRDDNAADLAVAPDGSSVVVVGRTVPAPMKDQYATAALDPATGSVLWSNTYGITTSGDGNLQCEAKSVAIARDGAVFVTGSAGAGSATVAYAPAR